MSSQVRACQGTAPAFPWGRSCYNACFQMGLQFLQHMSCSTVYIQKYGLANACSVDSIGIRCSRPRRGSICAGMFYCATLRQHIQFTCKIQLKLLPAKRLAHLSVPQNYVRRYEVEAVFAGTAAVLLYFRRNNRQSRGCGFLPAVSFSPAK